jgi:hypothetical protein
VLRRAVILLCAAGVAVTACGERRLKAAPASETAPTAQMVVTAGYGATVLRDANVAPDQTVMAALQATTTVTTRYGGRFVESIDGREGSLGRSEDWLYFVNGIEAGSGAADTTVHAGDVVWWDFRRWNHYVHVPVVVGGWPKPLKAGARPGPCRVLVGAEADVDRQAPAWQSAERAPQASGLTAWIDEGSVRIWDAAAQATRTVGGGRAVAAAVLDGSCATLVVAGLDASAATAAAKRIAADPGVLAHRYAVVFGAAGDPLAYGGGG